MDLTSKVIHVEGKFQHSLKYEHKPPNVNQNIIQWVTNYFQSLALVLHSSAVK